MLHTTLDGLLEAVQPILAGRVSAAAFDTETTEVLDERFTPFGTDTRMAGFSISYDLDGRGVDMYAAVRHQPYDWRRRRDLVEQDTKHNGAEWVRLLLEEEGITPEGAWAPGWNPNLGLVEVVKLLQALFGVSGVTWYAHNWPFDAKMLMVEGLGLPWVRMECTQALSTFTDERPVDLWDPTLNNGKGGYVHGGHGLKHLGEVHLGIPADAQAKLHEAQGALGEGGRKLMDYSMLPLRTVLAPYACMDTRLTLNLANHCKARDAHQDERVRELLRMHTLERRISCEMEQQGMPVDKDLALERCGQKEKELADLVQRIQGLAGRILNLGDGRALSAQLYTELGLPTFRDKEDTRKATLKQVRTRLLERGEQPTGPISADNAVELVDAILDYRAANKELTAFYRPLTQFGEGGHVHPVLSPIRARTTRFSASKPNAMQMKRPKKDKDPEVARKNQEACVRHLFKPATKYVFLACDFSQQELRVASHYAMAVPKAFEFRFTWNCTLAKRGDCKGREQHGPADDKEACRRVVHSSWRRPEVSRRPVSMPMFDGFLSGAKGFDPHQSMVDWCEKLSLDIDRDKGKTADFALLYGSGIANLMETLDCSWDAAKRVMDTFWQKAYPELDRVRLFIAERLRQVGKSTAYSGESFIRTMHGGRVYLDGSFKGLSYVVQRSCREILLKAMLSVNEYTRTACPSYRLMLPVHDELLFHLPEADLDQGHAQAICKLMVEAGSKSLVPMVVEPNVCHESWAIKEPLPPSWGWDGVQALKEATL